MEAEPKDAVRKMHARGSEQRQRQKRVTTRLTWHEYEQFVENAAKAGLKIPSYIREVGISAHETKTRTVRTVDADASMKLVAAMNRAGNNVNQIAKSFNQGDAPLARDCQDALKQLNEAIAAVLSVYERREA